LTEELTASQQLWLDNSDHMVTSANV